MNLYPSPPGNLCLLAISSQSIILILYLYFRCFTRVDLPHAIPPVNPTITTFPNTKSIMYIVTKGNAVAMSV